MPEGQAIIDQEDREFITSLGNWTGDAIWNPGPLFGYEGLMEFVCDPGGPNKTEQLIYPNVIIPKSADSLFAVNSGKILTVFGDPEISITLDDQNGNVINLLPILKPGYLFAGMNWNFITPTYWKRNGSRITITASFPDAAEGSMYLKFFSIIWVTQKIQYLPILGVG